MVGVIKQLGKWVGVASFVLMCVAPAARAVDVQTSINNNDKVCKQFADLHAKDPDNYPNPPAGCALDGSRTKKQLLAYNDDGSVNSANSYIYTFINIFVYTTATVSVIFLLIGAARYLTSTGDAKRIQQSKDTVLYAIIGLVVAILARPIADFVINKVSG